MTSTDLEVRRGYTLAELNGIAKAFAQSGYFKDVTDVAKAYTKVVAGQELGIGPMQAITQIHVIQGKPTLSAALVGALIKRSGRYDYRVKTLTDDECTLTFFESGERVGESTFTLADAKTAQLDKNPTWNKFRRNMLVSRALTNGARWYCPDVFGGSVYTPDELGAVIDGETGEVLALGPGDGAEPVAEEPERPAQQELSPTETADAAPPEEPPSDEGAPAADGKISAGQRRLLFARAKEKGLNEQELKDLVALTQKSSTTDLTNKDLEWLLDAIAKWEPETDAQGEPAA